MNLQSLVDQAHSARQQPCSRQACDHLIGSCVFCLNKCCANHSFLFTLNVINVTVQVMIEIGDRELIWRDLLPGVPGFIFPEFIRSNSQSHTCRVPVLSSAPNSVHTCRTSRCTHSDHPGSIRCYSSRGQHHCLCMFDDFRSLIHPTRSVMCVSMRKRVHLFTHFSHSCKESLKCTHLKNHFLSSALSPDILRTHFVTSTLLSRTYVAILIDVCVHVFVYIC